MNIQSKASALERTNIFLLLVSIAFFVPLTFSHPQWLVGIIINVLLFLSADLEFKKQLPIIIIPSLAALLHNTLFGTFTLFLLYFIPFIWIGNAILIKVMTYNKINQWHYLYRVGLASLLKALILFIVAFIYINIGLVPAIFLTAMGTVQLFTAIAGGLLSFFILCKIN